MSPAIAEVMDPIAAQGFAAASPVFSHHFRVDADIFDVEIGVPVPTRKGRR
jgi:hypothetical protein